MSEPVVFHKLIDCCSELGYQAVSSFSGKNDEKAFQVIYEERVLILNDRKENIQDMFLKIVEDENGDNDFLVIQQKIFDIPIHLITNSKFLRDLLVWNGFFTAGGFVVDEDACLLYQDTLQIKNLDLNELSASIYAIGMALDEWGGDLHDYYESELGD